MKNNSPFGSCGALQIKSAIAANSTSVKALIDTAFAEVKAQEVVTVTAPEQIPAVVDAATAFLASRRSSSQVAFVIVDLFLLKSEIEALERAEPDPTATFTWRPDAAQFRELFSYYGEIRKDGSYQQNFGERCLSSVRIVQSLWLVLDPAVIVIFNAGGVQIIGRDLASVCARLINEGVTWLYTEHDERQGGESFVNYLRLLHESASRRLQRTRIRGGA